MKRIKFFGLLALALFLVSSCAHITVPPGSPSASPAINRIIERGELVVGTAGSMPPLNMTTKTGQITGLEPDLARYFAGRLGVKLSFAIMPFAELLPALESGKVDMVLSGMTITPERNQRVAFVGPYYVSGKAALTKQETLARAQAAGDINKPEVTLAALAGSTSQLFVESMLPKTTLVTTKDYDEAVELVLQDKVDALIADYPICAVSVLRYPDRGLTSVFTGLTYEPIGIALPPNDPLLVNWVENALNRLEGGGELDILREYWLGDTPWLDQLP